MEAWEALGPGSWPGDVTHAVDINAHLLPARIWRGGGSLGSRGRGQVAFLFTDTSPAPVSGVSCAGEPSDFHGLPFAPVSETENEHV